MQATYFELVNFKTIIVEHLINNEQRESTVKLKRGERFAREVQLVLTTSMTVFWPWEGLWEGEGKEVVPGKEREEGEWWGLVQACYSWILFC